jgi:hypothetical protein
MVENLCPSCVNGGHCTFLDQASRIASEVPTLADTKAQINAAAEAFRQIAGLRVEARGAGCPYNIFDPNYPGKDKL